MEQKYIDALLKMGNEIHPHLGNGNHTNRLINKALTDNANLTRSECFDLGKYYDRMFKYLGAEKTKESYAIRLHAVLELKSLVYSPPKT